MTALAALQVRFQDAILGAHLTPGLFLREGESQDGGMAIYVNAYRARLIAALTDNYPVLRAALGDEQFWDLASSFIDAHPSPHRSIRWFGDRLCDYLTAHPAALPHSALFDVARMDWALRNAFDAADTVPCGVTEIAALAPEHWPALKFVFHPSAALLYLQWQIEPIWHALNADPDAATSPPVACDHALLVWRKGLECLWRSLGSDEARVLQGLVDGGNFGETCADLSLGIGASEATVHAASYLRQWLDDGLLIKAD